jgi:hypothetical protein
MGLGAGFVLRVGGGPYMLDPPNQRNRTEGGFRRVSMSETQANSLCSVVYPGAQE